MQKVFISYRRSDSAAESQFLNSELAARFGEEQVFFDRGIDPGANYVNTLREAVGNCEVLLVVIGPDWLEMKNDTGQRRLEVENDWVRAEVAAGLGRGVKVIPVLLRGAQPPPRKRLPKDIVDLDEQQTLVLDNTDLDAGVRRLVRTIEDHLGLTRSDDSEKKRRVVKLIRDARIALADATEMYMNCVRKAEKPDFTNSQTATIDLSGMLKDFDSDAHEAKLSEAHKALLKANKIDPGNTEVLLMLAEVLMDLTPEDPNDEQEALSRVMNIIGEPKSDIEKFQVAKAKFLMAQSGDHLHEEMIRDARAIFEKLDRGAWVNQCDLILRSEQEAAGSHAHPHPMSQPTQEAFNPVGAWRMQDSAAMPSQAYIQLFPVGQFQGQSSTPALGLQSALVGNWHYEAGHRTLILQGLRNGMIPFHLALHIQGRVQAGWQAFGTDGQSYLLAPA